MHLSLAKEHRLFFQKNGYIEFSDLIPLANLGPLIDALEKSVDKRLKEKRLPRDLWSEDSLIKKISLKRDFAEVAADLVGEHEIRLGYDQAILLPPVPEPNAETFLPSGITSLQQSSCIKPLFMGLLIRLSQGPALIPPSGNTPGTLFCPCPSTAGSGIFFSSKLLISWDPLRTLHNQQFLLITYAGSRPLYVLEKKDPCTHSLKHEGYVFGDALGTATHPLLFLS